MFVEHKYAWVVRSHAQETSNEFPSGPVWEGTSWEWSEQLLASLSELGPA